MVKKLQVQAGGLSGGFLTLYRQYKHIGLDVYGSARTGSLSMTQLKHCLDVRGRESGLGDVTEVLTDRA